MLEGFEEHFAKFKEEWEAASEVSPNLKWAIFPMGDEEIEFETAKRLMTLFSNLEGFIYFKEGQDPEIVVKALKDMLYEYEKRTKKDEIALAADQNEYKLHLGS